MKQLDDVKAEYKKSGLENGKVVELLKVLREQYKEMSDPTLTKVTRLMYEHIEANKAFLVDTFEEERGADEETSFEYLLSIMSDADNKFNREEIQEYKVLLLVDLGYQEKAEVVEED
ncbi:MAG: hypothetical protein KDC83_00435 [Flavobacteriales bacterium]|nr:hypothetical protein [Flavobacteriales bacterium]